VDLHRNENTTPNGIRKVTRNKDGVEREGIEENVKSWLNKLERDVKNYAK